MAVNFAARLARLKKDRKVLLGQIQKITRDLAEVETDIDATEAEIGKAPLIATEEEMRRFRGDPAPRKVATTRKPRAKK